MKKLCKVCGRESHQFTKKEIKSVNGILKHMADSGFPEAKNAKGTLDYNIFHTETNKRIRALIKKLRAEK